MKATKKYAIPVFPEVLDVYEVEADSLEEAIQIMKQSYRPSSKNQTLEMLGDYSIGDLDLIKDCNACLDASDEKWLAGSN